MEERKLQVSDTSGTDGQTGIACLLAIVVVECETAEEESPKHMVIDRHITAVQVNPEPVRINLNETVSQYLCIRSDSGCLRASLVVPSAVGTLGTVPGTAGGFADPSPGESNSRGQGAIHFGALY